jgi:hypothetical protein
LLRMSLLTPGEEEVPVPVVGSKASDAASEEVMDIAIGCSVVDTVVQYHILDAEA